MPEALARGGGPFRILRIATRLNVGGPARQILALEKEILRRGIPSRLVVGRVGVREGELWPENEHVAPDRLPALARSVNVWNDARALRGLLNRIDRFSPSVVHTHMAKAGILGRYAARRRTVPVIAHTFHGHVLSEYFPAPVTRALIRLEQQAARWSDVLFAVAEQTKQELLQMGIGDPRQWRVLPPGLDLTELTTSTLTREEARQRIGLPVDRPAVGIAARLVSVKDHRTFLRAVKSLADSHPQVMVVVAGDGPLRSTLEREARQSLGDRVRFPGWIDDLSALYRALDVVVLTSRDEGTPVALIEAAVSGTPAVATRVGGVAEVVVHGETGFLTRPGDHEAIAHHMRQLLLDEQLALRMGLAASERVRGRFTAEALATSVIEAYLDVLNRKGSGSS